MAAKAMQILIALDGSSGSEAVFSDLKRAGLPKRLVQILVSGCPRKK